MKKIKLTTTIALVLIVAFLGIGSVSWYFALHKVIYVEVIPIEIETKDFKLIGLNADPSLDFGKLPSSGGMAIKKMNTYNDVDFPVKIQVRLKGEAKDYVYVSDNNFILLPGESKTIDVVGVVPSNFDKVTKINGEAHVVYLRS